MIGISISDGANAGAATTITTAITTTASQHAAQPPQHAAQPPQPAALTRNERKRRFREEQAARQAAATAADGGAPQKKQQRHPLQLQVLQRHTRIHPRKHPHAMGNSKSSQAASAADKALAKLFARQTALSADQFALAAISHHGLPSSARVLAVCGLQGLLAVGTSSGAVKVYGKDELEVLLDVAPPHAQQTSLALGVVFMKFTAHQRLVVTYADSSIRVFDLADPGRVHAELRGSWTTSSITCIETICYQNFPYFFVATDDGDIYVVQEDTCRVSSYTVSPRDVGVTSTEETKHTQFPSAMASNPRDANQLLIAYEASPLVFLWDFAKRKVVREYAFAKKKASQLTRSSTSSGTNSSFGANTSSASGAFGSGSGAAGTEMQESNSPQTLSWHSSGKRFAAGYKFGGFAVFRVDKNQGHYHAVETGGSEGEVSLTASPVRQLQWISAPPTSKNSHLPGAILYSGGGTNALTLVYPPKDVSADDAISDFVKSEHLAWRVATISTINKAEIANFAVASDQVDYSSKIAPLSVVMLSGNPMDGCLPCVSVQPLPCFVRFREDDKEDWEWSIEQLPRPCAIPPLLQFSPLTTFSVVNLMHSDGALQDDLFTTWEQEKHDPLFQLLASEDFEWPINGGNIVEPLLSRFLSSSGAIKDEMQTIFQNGTLLLTGHQNGFVLFWELIPPAERASKGTIHLLHVVDVPLQMAPIPATKDISCLTFCHDARVLVVGFSTGEIAVLEFGQWKQRRPSSLLEAHFSSTENAGATTTDGESGKRTADSEEKKTAAATAGSIDPSADHSPPLLSASLKDVTGFKTLFTLHIHNQAIKHLSLSTAYGYFAASDAGGVVSLTQIASQSYKLLIFELSSTTEEEPVSVESLLMSELVQATDIPAPGTSAGGGGSGGKSSKGSPIRRLSRSSANGAGTDASFIMQHREVVPVLFVGRGNGKLEMFHVQTGAKMVESLVDPRKASSLSSIIMVDADGKRTDIPGRVWIEQGDGIATGDDAMETLAANTESAPTREGDGDGNGDDSEMSATARHVRSPSTELEYTKRIVLDVINEQSAASSTDVVLVQNEEQLANATITSASTGTWARSNVIEVTVPGGSSLGLHLFTDIEQQAVVKGFVSDNQVASMIESKGVHAGHVITSINGLDLTSYGRHVICGVLEKIRDREKVIVFAEGFNYTLTADKMICSNISTSSSTVGSKEIGVFNDLLGDGTNHTDVERPRFLVCTCGKAIHLMQAAIPKASEMASGPREMPARPLASVEVRAAVVTTSVIRVPVAERVENCLVVIDQSNHLYVISLLALEIIWEKECFSLGNSLDGICCEVSYGGELIVASSFGEMERFSFFAEHTAIENALLERKCIKTRLHLQEREFSFDKDPSDASPTKKKSGIFAADAGKMFKKLVTGMKDKTDLNKVFQFSKEQDEREQLMGGSSDRASLAAAREKANDADGETKKNVGKGLGDTKDALMQAAQHLNERGEKLGDLALKTEQMKQTSEDFYHTMKAFNEKNANKKWYEF